MQTCILGGRQLLYGNNPILRVPHVIHRFYPKEVWFTPILSWLPGLSARSNRWWWRCRWITPHPLSKGVLFVFFPFLEVGELHCINFVKQDLYLLSRVCLWCFLLQRGTRHLSFLLGGLHMYCCPIFKWRSLQTNPKLRSSNRGKQHRIPPNCNKSVPEVFLTAYLLFSLLFISFGCRSGGQDYYALLQKVLK